MWRAAADRVVIQKTSSGPKRTAGGLYLPDKMKSKGLEDGTVLAVGPDAKGVKEGDTAFFITQGAVEVQPGIFSVNADYVAAIQRQDEPEGQR